MLSDSVINSVINSFSANALSPCFMAHVSSFSDLPFLIEIKYGHATDELSASAHRRLPVKLRLVHVQMMQLFRIRSVRERRDVFFSHVEESWNFSTPGTFLPFCPFGLRGSKLWNWLNFNILLHVVFVSL